MKLKINRLFKETIFHNQYTGIELIAPRKLNGKEEKGFLEGEKIFL